MTKSRTSVCFSLATLFATSALVSCSGPESSSESDVTAWRDNPLASSLYFPDYQRSDGSRPEAHGQCPTATSRGFRAVTEVYDRQRVRYYVRVSEQARGTLVFFHGNGGTACAYSTFFSTESFRDYNVALAEFPGYGGDDTDINEAALTSNAVALVKAVKARVPGKPLAVWGYSLGSGMANFAASRVSVDALVLSAPYDSILNVARDLKPNLSIFLPFIGQRHAYRAYEWVPQITASTLVIYSTSDGVIPPARTETLLRSFRAGVASTVKLTDGSDHSNLFFRSSRGHQAVIDFLKRKLAH